MSDGLLGRLEASGPWMRDSHIGGYAKAGELMLEAAARIRELEHVSELSAARFDLLCKLHICDCCGRQVAARDWDGLYTCCSDCAWCQSLGHCGEGEPPSCCHGVCRDGGQKAELVSEDRIRELERERVILAGAVDESRSCFECGKPAVWVVRYVGGVGTTHWYDYRVCCDEHLPPDEREGAVRLSHD